MPDNVTLLAWSFTRMKTHIQSKFDFTISLVEPYKLCDFKPAYGYIFEEYIKEYDFWGYCDVDMLFGNVRYFLTPQILENNQVIGFLGHFSIYANNNNIKKLYEKDGSLYDYRTVFSTPYFYAFDEITGMMQIVLKNKISHYYHLKFADINTRFKNEIRITTLYVDAHNYKDHVLYWENGRIWQAFWDGREIRSEEYMYLHFSKRKPMAIINDENKGMKSFYFHNEGFVEKEVGLPPLYVPRRQSRRDKVMAAGIEYLAFLIKKIKMVALMSSGQRKVWMAQRKFRRRMLWPDSKS